MLIAFAFASEAWADEYTVVSQIRYRLNHSDHTAAIVQSQYTNAENYFWRADGNFVGWSNETVIIPETISYNGSNYSVTRLEEFNFSRCIVTMYLPKTVRYIGHIHCVKPIICKNVTYWTGFKGQINLFITADWPDIDLGACNAGDKSSLDGSNNFSIYLCCDDYNSFALNPTTASGTTPCGDQYRTIKIYPWFYSAEGTGASSHALPHYAQRGSDFKYFNHIEISNAAGGTIVSDTKTWPKSVFSISNAGGTASIEYNEKWWEPFKILPDPGNYPIVELVGQRIKEVYAGSDDYYRVETPPTLNNSLYSISYVPEQTNVTVTSNGGAEVKVRTYTSNGSEISNTISAQGGSNTQSYNFYPYNDNQIELEINYDINDYDVNLTYSDSGNNSANWNFTSKDDGTKVYGIEYAKGHNVQINVQFTPKSKLRKFNFVNFGEGSVHFYGKANGEDTHYSFRGYWTATPSFDYGSLIKVVVTPPDGQVVKSINAYPYILKSDWDVDQTTGVVTVDDWILMKDETNRMDVKYGPPTIAEGTHYNVHLAVEGAEGVCFISIDDYANDWVDEDDNTIPYSEMEAGEMFDVIGSYSDGQYLTFYSVHEFEGDEDGVMYSVAVYANGELVEAEEVGTESGDFYSIPLDGSDMDVRIVFSSNSRELKGSNGNGGSVAFYKEGSDTPIKTYPSDRFIMNTLLKAETYYVVITPNTGKTVRAILRNGSLLPSLNSYRQSDGTYRVPLENLGDGDNIYWLEITYSDDPYYTFNLSVVGDGALICIPFKKENGNIQAIRQVMASESEGRNRVVKAYYSEIGDTGYVEFYAKLPKEGEVLKVYFDGEEVTDKLTITDAFPGYLRGVIQTNPTEDELGGLNSVSVLAIYEKDPNLIEWHGSMIGDVDHRDYIAIMVDGGDVELDLYQNILTGTASLDLSKIGRNLQLYITGRSGRNVQMLFNGEDYTSLLSYEDQGKNMLYKIEADTLTQFFVDGNWVFSFSKPDEVIEFADTLVKAICVANWDDNKDGELSTKEAAAVTTLKVLNSEKTVYASPFKENANITSFKELQYFTGLTEICDSAFMTCQKLDSIIVPKNVKTIGQYAFQTCNKLIFVQLPEGLTTIKNSAFKRCTVLPALHLPETVTTLEDNALSQLNALQAIKLPENLANGSNALYNSWGLKSIYIPAKLTSTKNIISYCKSLKSITVSPQNTVWDSRDDCNALIRTVDNTLVQGSMSTIIPNGVVIIGPDAFSSSNDGIAIDSIKIPNSVKTIQDRAFTRCTNLKYVELPSSLESIGANAFSSCTALTSVVSKIKTPFHLLNAAVFDRLNDGCVLTVPKGTRDAYIAAGWTTDIFKGGIVEEDDSDRFDVNRDGSVTIGDVTKLVNVILGK